MSNNMKNLSAMILLVFLSNAITITTATATAHTFSHKKMMPIHQPHLSSSTTTSSSTISSSSSTSSIHTTSINHQMVLSIPRGGGYKSISIDDDGDGSSSSSVVMRKVRNVIRSFLSTSQNKVPIVASLVKGVLGCMELVTGIRLLPNHNNDEKGGKGKPKRKSKNKGGSNSTSNGNSTSNSRKSQDDNETKSKAKQPSKSKSKQQPNKSPTESKKKQTTPTGKTKPKPAQKQKQNQSAQAKTHLTKDLKASNPNYRIQRELKQFLTSPPPNLSVKVGKNIRIWIISMVGTPGSLYEGERYRLRVQFPLNYPTEPPSVYFLSPTPRHEHVYTNGDICLSLLGKDWRPNMTAQSIAMSILSILNGAGRKSLPMDNAAHAQSKPGQKQDDWVYHDDNC